MSNYSSGRLNLAERNTTWTKIFEYVFDGSTVLDIGCSDGRLGSELKERKNSKVYGIEIDEGDYKLAKKVLDKVYRFNIETDEIPTELKKIKFDVIILADVIEHLINPVDTLKIIKNFLKPNGRVIFSIPNMAHTSVRLQLLKGEFSYTNTGLIDKTHLHFYDFEEVKRVFRNSGFQIEHIDANTLPYPASFLQRELHSLGLKDDGFIERITNDKTAQTFQFVGYGSAVRNPRDIKEIRLNTTTPELGLMSYIDQLKITSEEKKQQDIYIAKLELENESLKRDLDKLSKILPVKTMKKLSRFLKRQSTNEQK